MFSISNIQAGLNTEFLGQQIKFIDQTPSTNDDAWKCFHENELEGTLIITNNQVNGRGRRKSKWSSTPDKSLTFSFLLIPNIPLENLGLLPLLTGVSIIKGIWNMTKIDVGLKWPNDIMINHKKIGGILIESNTKKNKLGVVIGIGINVNENENDIPLEIQKKTSSLSIDSGKEFNLSLILSSILNEFEHLYVHGWDHITTLWQQYCVHQNEDVIFHDNEEFIHGKFMGITKSGYARMQVNGKIKTFSSGIITL